MRERPHLACWARIPSIPCAWESLWDWTRTMGVDVDSIVATVKAAMVQHPEPEATTGAPLLKDAPREPRGGKGLRGLKCGRVDGVHGVGLALKRRNVALEP